ncbi:hypothetical protein [Rhizobium phage RHEph12]|nr:hypothetical protein [Rhizobium phage RHEph12]
MRKLLTTIMAGWLLTFYSPRDVFTVITPDHNGTYSTYEDCVAAGKIGIQKSVRVDGTTGVDDPTLRDTIIVCVPNGNTSVR